MASVKAFSCGCESGRWRKEISQAHNSTEKSPRSMDQLRSILFQRGSPALSKTTTVKTRASLYGDESAVEHPPSNSRQGAAKRVERHKVQILINGTSNRLKQEIAPTKQTGNCAHKANQAKKAKKALHQRKHILINCCECVRIGDALE